MKRKRLLSALTALALCLGLTGGTLAAEDRNLTHTGLTGGGSAAVQDGTYRAGGGTVTAQRIGNGLRLELDSARIYAPVTVDGDLELVLNGENEIRTFTSDPEDQTPAVQASGTIRVTGGGRLTIRAAAGEKTLAAGFEVPGVRAGGEVEVAEGSTLSALIGAADGTVRVCGQVVLQNLAEFSGLTVPAGTSLTIPAVSELRLPGPEALRGEGTIRCDGVLRLDQLSGPDAAAELGLSGDGLVTARDPQTGEYEFYTCGGTALPVRRTPLDFTVAGGYDPAAVEEEDHYRFIPAREGEPPRLVLRDLQLVCREREAALTVPDGTVVELRGSSGLYCVESGGTGPAETAAVAVRSSGSGYPALTIGGTGSLRVLTPATLAGETYLTLEQEAAVTLLTRRLPALPDIGWLLRGNASLSARYLRCALFAMEDNPRAVLDSSGYFGLFAEQAVLIRGGTLDASACALPVSAPAKLNGDTELPLAVTVPAGGRQEAMTFNGRELWAVVPAWEKQLTVDPDHAGGVSTAARHVVLGPGTGRFIDVPTSHWAWQAVEFVAARGIFHGTGPDTFTPEGTMTRGMLVQVLHNLEHNPAPSGAPAFTDVAPDAWYARAVAWAAEQGVVNGMGEGIFAPEDPVTREQMAAVLWRYLGRPEAAAELPFRDAEQISGYALPAITWAVDRGILNGMGDGILAPGGNATRAQVAAIFMRLLG